MPRNCNGLVRARRWPRPVIVPRHRFWGVPQLFNRLDMAALDQQAREVVADGYSKRAESRLTHPLLLRRYARVCGLMPA
ncbi:MAG: hypothetical protein N2379_00385 [Verrucomicrobiae bacterium]|nr:hypothetical protein [Verrucomicrobiae bacterium]